jgi:hypothetical protein
MKKGTGCLLLALLLGCQGTTGGGSFDASRPARPDAGSPTCDPPCSPEQYCNRLGPVPVCESDCLGSSPYVCGPGYYCETQSDWIHNCAPRFTQCGNSVCEDGQICVSGTCQCLLSEESGTGSDTCYPLSRVCDPRTRRCRMPLAQETGTPWLICTDGAHEIPHAFDSSKGELVYTCKRTCATDSECSAIQKCYQSGPWAGHCNTNYCGFSRDGVDYPGVFYRGCDGLTPDSGTCVSTGGTGLCIESGLLQDGEPCTVDIDRLPLTEARGQSCSGGAICEPVAAGRGRCQRACNVNAQTPGYIGQFPAGCDAGFVCAGFVNAAALEPQPGQCLFGCTLFPSSSCPTDPGGYVNTCVPTPALDGTGVCLQRAAVPVGLGQACSYGDEPPAKVYAANPCNDGQICELPDPKSFSGGTCRQLCDRNACPNPGGTCAMCPGTAPHCEQMISGHFWVSTLTSRVGACHP